MPTKPEGKPRLLLLRLRMPALLLPLLMLTACGTPSVVLQKIPPPTPELLKSEQTDSAAYSASAQAWSKKASEWLKRAKDELPR